MLRPQIAWPRYSPVPRNRRGRLRAMFVITSMPVGGAETLLVNLVEGFDPKRIQAEIVCLKEPGPLGEAIAARWPLHAGLLRSKYDLSVLPRLARLFRRREADAVVTVGAGDKMFWGRLAAWTAGVPTILSALHSTGWPDGVGRMNRWLTPITDGFIAVAAHHAEHLRDRERFPAARVHTIRNGIDTERFTPQAELRHQIRQELGIGEAAPVIGIVAALRPEKNHEMFVRVARRVVGSRPDAQFLIIGDGPERPKIEQSRDGAGLAEHVRLLGTRHDTPALLAAMDAFLLCSHNEASPVSILEALASGVPVVATRVGSVGESVIEGESGFLVDVDDDTAMAEHVLELISDRTLGQRLGQNGRRLVIQTGSLTSMVDGYSQLIEGIYDAQVLRRNSSGATVSPSLATRTDRYRRSEPETNSNAAPR